MVRKYNYEDRPQCDYKGCQKKIDALANGFAYCSEHYIALNKKKESTLADIQIRSS